MRVLLFVAAFAVVRMPAFGQAQAARVTPAPMTRPAGVAGAAFALPAHAQGVALLQLSLLQGSPIDLAMPSPIRTVVEASLGPIGVGIARLERLAAPVRMQLLRSVPLLLESRPEPGALAARIADLETARAGLQATAPEAARALLAAKDALQLLVDRVWEEGLADDADRMARALGGPEGDEAGDGTPPELRRVGGRETAELGLRPYVRGGRAERAEGRVPSVAPRREAPTWWTAGRRAAALLPAAVLPLLSAAASPAAAFWLPLAALAAAAAAAFVFFAPANTTAPRGVRAVASTSTLLGALGLTLAGEYWFAGALVPAALLAFSLSQPLGRAVPLNHPFVTLILTAASLISGWGAVVALSESEAGPFVGLFAGTLGLILATMRSFEGDARPRS